jgi:hypothetical protein
VKILFSVILSLMFLVFWSCSDAGDPLSNDCTEGLDCAGECGGTATLDVCGECEGSGLNSDNCCGDSSSCVHYSTEIQPIFTNKCTNCHGTSGGLTLTSYSGLMNGGNSGDVVISENGSESRLIQKLRGTASGSQMPASGCCLDESVIQVIETWIDEGALDN